ncbi:hypothetical protein MHK_004834, partial [Candidatus Magnetomorum sp. HK-1]
VQTIDTAFAGSAFSQEISFTVVVNPPHYTEDNSIPLLGVAYGSADFVDYDNDGDLDIIITGETESGSTAKVYRNTDGSFTEDAGINLPDVYYSDVAFGDYDNDDDIDILITGGTESNEIFAKVYQNTGGSFNEDTEIKLIDVCCGNSEFGDYDNDGDLDILISGYTGSDYIARVYQNKGGIFSEDKLITLSGVAYGTSTFGDYDNDSDLDIIIIGGADNNLILGKVYRNTGGCFNEDTDINLTPVVNSS